MNIQVEEPRRVVADVTVYLVEEVYNNPASALRSGDVLMVDRSGGIAQAVNLRTGFIMDWAPSFYKLRTLPSGTRITMTL